MLFQMIFTYHLIETSSVDHHLYADDTQLFISFSPASFSISIAHLLSVVNQISQWMSANLLCLNQGRPSPSETMMHFPHLFQISPTISEKNFGLSEFFLQFYLFPKNFLTFIRQNF